MNDDTAKTRTTPPFLHQETAAEEFLATIENIGLGLSIGTRLADLMGGSLWVESSEGNGSTFFLQLPFVVTASVVERHDRRSSDRVLPRAEGASLRILLVDDQEMNLILVKRLLQKAGHTYQAVRDSCAARRDKEVPGACLTGPAGRRPGKGSDRHSITITCARK